MRRGKTLFMWRVTLGLTRHKISDRETCATLEAGNAWMANTQKHTYRAISRFAASPD
jgi:hypothetical protein